MFTSRNTEAFARLAVASLIGWCVPSQAEADVIAYQHSTHHWPNGPFEGPGVLTPIASSWLGQAINLNTGGGPQTITGFDMLIADLGGAVPIAAADLRLHVKIYDGYSSAGSPVFSNLVSDQTITSPLATSPGNYIIQHNPTPDPFFVLPVPVTVSSSGPIGIAMVWEVFSGGVWSTISRVPMVRHQSASAPTIGSSGMIGGNGYYSRGIAALPDISGNFDPSNFSTAGADPSRPHVGIDMQVWVVPSPGAAVLVSLGGLIAARRRRSFSSSTN